MFRKIVRHFSVKLYVLNNLSLGYLLRKIKQHSHKYLYINLHSNLIHNTPQLETTQNNG